MAWPKRHAKVWMKSAQRQSIKWVYSVHPKASTSNTTTASSAESNVDATATETPSGTQKWQLKNFVWLQTSKNRKIKKKSFTNWREEQQINAKYSINWWMQISFIQIVHVPFLHFHLQITFIYGTSFTTACLSSLNEWMDSYECDRCQRSDDHAHIFNYFGYALCPVASTLQIRSI